MENPPLALGAVSLAEQPEFVVLTWWPAAVRLPDSQRALHNCKVFAADTGLFVYGQAQRDGAAEVQLIYSAPIDYGKTPRPPSDYASQRAGFVIPTGAGDVLVAPAGTCGCAFKTLKRWTPEWASRSRAWEQVGA